MQLQLGPVVHARGISVVERMVARTVGVVAREDRSVVVLVGAVATARPKKSNTGIVLTNV